MIHYQAALEQISTSPKIYACDCSRKTFGGERHSRICQAGKLSLETPGIAWRYRTTYLSLQVPDKVTGGYFLVDLRGEMGDFVVRKKDGAPSYQLACVVDDYLFGINRVGRGQDLLASTAAQALLISLVSLRERWLFRGSGRILILRNLLGWWTVG